MMPSGIVTTLKDIRQFAHQIAREFRPQKIILFGSHAYGKPSESSDVDMMVILPFRGSAIRKAVEIELKVRAPFPLDLLVRTPEKVREPLALHDWLMRDVVEKGKVLWEASHS